MNIMIKSIITASIVYFVLCLFFTLINFAVTDSTFKESLKYLKSILLAPLYFFKEVFNLFKGKYR